MDGYSVINSFWKELSNAESRLEYLESSSSQPYEIEVIHTED